MDFVLLSVNKEGAKPSLALAPSVYTKLVSGSNDFRLILFLELTHIKFVIEALLRQ